MAHILVYLQRTPTGLHPASALSLCIARDIASNRGASVTALCPGDAGTLDAGVVHAAGRFGADVMVFLGPDGLSDIVARLHPVHLLTPWTPEGLEAVRTSPLGSPTPRWVARARPPGAGADTVTGIVAGVLPWHALDAELDPEYLGDVDAVALPPWVAPLSTVPSPGFVMIPQQPLSYVAHAGLDPDVARTLARLGATQVAANTAAEPDAQAGVLLVFGQGDQALPDALHRRSAHTRLVYFPGPDASFDATWMHADLVVPGPWTEAVARLHEPLWRAALA